MLATRSKYLYQKLVQVALYKKLTHMSVNLVQVSCMQLTQLYCRTKTLWHVTRTVQRDWPTTCYRFCCH